MESVLATTSSETDPLARHFAAWRASGRRALVPYVTAGFPTPAVTGEVLGRLAEVGADVIELGVPFSDPLADGPTIQRSSHQAIEQGVSLAWTLEALAGFRARHTTPVVLFTYLNPVLAYGVERFVEDAVAAGAEGVLLTDLPLGSDPGLEETFERSPLALVRLVAPTTARERALEIARRSQGFVYYISRTGVTGARKTLRESLVQEVAALRAATEVPIVVGFGISTPAQAAEVGRVADGVAVGSALIDALDREGVRGAEALVRAMREALDGIS
ncbi:MAG TPA: tryptophan synthase subunit alpha [Longimicrobiales bacterium]